MFEKKMGGFKSTYAIAGEVAESGIVVIVVCVVGQAMWMLRCLGMDH